MGLPKKKWFGNKSVDFVEKRKMELEKYLNKIACCNKPEFYKFVKQIKDGEFNQGFKEKFSIMWPEMIFVKIYYWILILNNWVL